MPANKSRRIETTDQATAGLTLPLKAKLGLVFGGFVTLFILSFAVGGWLFFRFSSQSEVAVNRQNRLALIYQLQTAFTGEQGAVSRALATAQAGTLSGSAVSDFETMVYQITFDNNMALIWRDPALSEISATLSDLDRRHTNLATNFGQIIADLQAGAVAKAARQWESNAPLVQDLTARLITFGEEQAALTSSAQADLQRQQNESLIGLGLVAGIGGVLLVTLIWLANHFVIGPMGRLNIKLSQLLYGQTARITDRLNLLEHEINNESQKVTAARHDLKLPLSNIRNAAEISLIYQPDLTLPVKENLNDIIEITDSSARQINSLLARKNNRLELERADLWLLVARVVELVDLREFNVHLKLELDEAVLDFQLIEHVLLNLLSNARKFSTGGIGVGTRLAPFQWGTGDRHKHEPGEHPAEETEIWVWNDGPVISADERETIFRPGGQTDLGRQAGGHGLGLSIVKSIVERHGGRVVVESHEKVGTTFRVFLPYVSLPVEERPEAETAGALGETEHLTT